MRLPICTAATSPTRTGKPPRMPSEIARTSSRVRMLPSVRTKSASSFSERRPAPSLRLFTSSACCNSASDKDRAASAAISGMTSKLFTMPPSAFTSATPLMLRKAGRIVQSSSVRFSVREIFPSIVNIKTSPSGVVIGARPPSTLLGRLASTPDKRSLTCWRAQ